MLTTPKCQADYVTTSFCSILVVLVLWETPADVDANQMFFFFNPGEETQVVQYYLLKVPQYYSFTLRL